jgi:hypothetical protein
MRLGKQEHKFDERTLLMANYMLPDIRVPYRYNFDRGKTPLPLPMWGNDKWGDCVIAGEANHLLRLERIEQRRTVKLTEQIVVDRYKHLTGAQQPDDANDTGLVVLEAMRNWYHEGWTVNGRNYTIAAYGELEPGDRKQLRMGVYLLHGIHLGYWLPLSARKMTDEGVWDYQGQTGAEWQPGSWGGHLVYSKAFDEKGLEILTWGQKVKVTNAFIEKYCDEAWAVVDNFDSWRVRQTINVAALTNKLQLISSKPINR